MARIRTIKPEFWTDEKLVELEPWERLLFIGIWNFSDDDGFLTYSPKRIKMQVFPGDDLDVAAGLERLIGAGFLAVFDTEIGPVLQVRNWSKHQKVTHPTPSKYRSLLPRDHEDFEPLTEPVQSSLEDSGELCLEGKGREGKGIEGNGREGKGKGKRPATTLPPGFAVTDHLRAWAVTNTPSVDLLIETEKFKNYAASKDRRYSDWDAAWRNWMLNAVKFAPAPVPAEKKATWW